MSVIRHLRSGLSALLHGEQSDRDVDDEVRHFLEQSTAAHQARGLSPDQARRAATLELGNVTVVRERVRSSGWEHLLEAAAADARYAIRRLRTNPAFTFAAVLTLALGIGASTTVFSAISPILIEPLPFPRADRLVTIDDRTDAGTAMPPTLGTYYELQARNHSFDALAAADAWRPSLTSNVDPEQLHGQRVTASYFGVLGVSPIVGRGFTADEDRPGGPNVVVLGDGLWRRRFGGDRSIVGHVVQLDGDDYTVVGIMPPTFANVVAPSAELWSPMRERATGEFDSRAWGHHYQIIGRLAPTATIASASSEIAQIGRVGDAAYPRPPWAKFERGLLVRSMKEEVTSAVRPALYAIIGAVLLLLGIAAVNVTNLLLARGAQRRPELAMRIALGAGGGRLVRQMLTESLVLAACGGVFGLAIADVGVRLFVAWSPPGLPRADAIGLDWRVFAFALALTAIIGVAVGLVPALTALHTDAAGSLQHGTRRSTSGRVAGRSALVVAEVSLALVLLVSAGLLVRSVRRLVSVPPGFDPSNVVTMQVVLAGHAFHSDTARLRSWNQIIDAVRQVPGVVSVGTTSQLPLSGDVDGYGYEWQSLPTTTGGNDGSALRYAVSPGYFAAMRIPLRAGRLIDATDRPGAPEAILVNESLARRLFGDRNPIGERVRFGGQMGGDQWDYVVGVVADVRQYSLAVPAPDAFYVATGQWAWVDNVATLVARTSGDAAAAVPSIKRAVWSVDATAPIQRIATMDSFIAASAGQRRLALAAIETFALAALLLAAVGLYGVISGGVTERLREIGIRTALGATPGEILRQVVGRGVALTILGALIGLGGSAVATRLLASMLFSVSRTDPVTYAGVVGLLTAVAIAAAWLPARRAAGVDPTIALRAE